MHLRRSLFDWEIAEAAKLMLLLENIKLNPSIEDRRVWKGAPSREFSMSSYYQVLNHNAISHYPADFMWKSKVPSKVAFFLWVVSHGKTPTLDLL